MEDRRSIKVVCPKCETEFYAPEGGEELILMSLTAASAKDFINRMETVKCPNPKCRIRFRVPVLDIGADKKNTEEKDE